MGAYSIALNGSSFNTSSVWREGRGRREGGSERLMGRATQYDHTQPTTAAHLHDSIK